MLRKVLSIFLACSLTAGLAACGSSGSGKTGDNVTLRFATSAIADGGALEGILDEFAKEYPNVTIELEESPGNDLITKINTDIMADNCPDVFTYWRPEKKWDVDKYIELGALADLGELKNDDFYKGMFPDYAWNTATVNGITVAIPRTNYYTAFIVNKAIFEEEGIDLPTDWNKLVAACEQLHEKGYIVWATDTGEGLDDASRLFNAVIEATLGNERGLALMQGQESWQQPDVVEALGYFMDVAKAGYAPDDSAVLDSTTVITKYLNTGRAGMLINNAGQVWNHVSDEMMDQLAVLNFPLTPTSVMTDPFNELDLTNLVYMSSKAWEDPAKREAAIALIKKITSNEAAKLYAEQDRLIVPHLTVDIDESKVHPIQNEAADLAYSAQACKWMLSFTSSDVVDDFRLTINGVWYGEFDSPQELAQKLDDSLYGKQ